MNSPTSQHEDSSLTAWLRANPTTAFTILVAVESIIVGIVAIITLDTSLGKVAGCLLFAMLAVTGFFCNRIWVNTDGRQTFISVTSAIFLAGGAGLAVWAYGPTRTIDTATTRSATPQPAAVITIDAPKPGALVGPRVTITGTVANLATTESVWMFSQPFSASQPNEPLSQIDPYEQCSLSGNRTVFTCPSAFNGAVNGDYCRIALLWVSVVDADEQDLVKNAATTQHWDRPWPSPPLKGESSEYVLVQRASEVGSTCSGI
jgi:hypothetical protein